MGEYNRMSVFWGRKEFFTLVLFICPTRRQKHLKFGFWANEDGMRVLHFGAAEDAEALIQAEIQMIGTAQRKMNFLMPY